MMGLMINRERCHYIAKSEAFGVEFELSYPIQRSGDSIMKDWGGVYTVDGVGKRMMPITSDEQFWAHGYGLACQLDWHLRCFDSDLGWGAKDFNRWVYRLQCLCSEIQSFNCNWATATRSNEIKAVVLKCPDGVLENAYTEEFDIRLAVMVDGFAGVGAPHGAMLHYICDKLCNTQDMEMRAYFMDAANEIKKTWKQRSEAPEVWGL